MAKKQKGNKKMKNMKNKSCWSQASICDQCGQMATDLLELRTDAEYSPTQRSRIAVCARCADEYGACYACELVTRAARDFCGSTYCARCADELIACCDRCGEEIYADDSCDCSYRSILYSDDYEFEVSLAKLASEPDSTPMIGVEIEFFGGDDCTADDLESILDRANYGYKPDPTAFSRDFCCAKTDCSVSIELNTDAVSIGIWQNQRDRVATLLADLVEIGFRTGRGAGIHAHVSRSSFENEENQKNFVLFLSKCRNFSEKIAGRNTHYAVFLPASDLIRSEIVLGPDDKYKCVNTSHSHTLEVRMFKSTLSVDEFFTNIEFVNALAVFCDTRAEFVFDEFSPDRLFVLFLAYLNANRSAYADLADRLYDVVADCFQANLDREVA